MTDAFDDVEKKMLAHCTDLVILQTDSNEKRRKMREDQGPQKEPFQRGRTRETERLKEPTKIKDPTEANGQPRREMRSLETSR